MGVPKQYLCTGCPKNKLFFLNCWTAVLLADHSGRITEGIQVSTHNANKVQKVPFLGHCVKSLF